MNIVHQQDCGRPPARLDTARKNRAVLMAARFTQSGKLTRTCGGVFKCPHCLRWVGWCFGCDDGHPELCDDCWAKEEAATGGEGTE